MAAKNKNNTSGEAGLSGGSEGAPEMNLADAEAALSADQRRRLEKEFSVDRDDTPHEPADDLKDDDDEEAVVAVKNKHPEQSAKAFAKGDDDHEEWAKKLQADLADPSTEEDDPDNSGREKPKKQSGGNIFKRYWRHKGWTIPVTILVVALAVAFGWSLPRYIILGHFIEKPYTVELLDSETHKPVSGADLSIDGSNVKTDAEGKATLHAKVGPHNLVIDKKYYDASRRDVFGGSPGPNAAEQVAIKPTGRQVPLTVTDKITAKPLADATIKAVGTEVKTDKDGKATMVLPADKTSLKGTVSAKGYNDQDVTIQITENNVKENSFSLTATGKVYFLSRQSGTIDVVKTDLDGGNRQTVVTGTGKEEDGNTVLLASRDWKYLALLAKRDSSPAKLYLIDTSTDKMAVMDEGDATFSLAGWSEHTFAYSVSRNSFKAWQPNRQAVKTYNADKKQIATIDQTEASGDSTNYDAQYYTELYLLRDKLVYGVSWNSYHYYYSPSTLADKNIAIREVAVGTASKSDLKTFPADKTYIQRLIPYSPTEAYIDIYSNTDGKERYYEYDDGKIEDVDDADAQRVASQPSYPTYLLAPSGTKTAWSEPRDGRSVFFVGDAAGANGKQIADLDDEYQVYGWYTDDYMLISKKGSELYILPAGGGTPLKITDYHKPQYSYRGYGGGYGGL